MPSVALPAKNPLFFVHVFFVPVPPKAQHSLTPRPPLKDQPSLKTPVREVPFNPMDFLVPELQSTSSSVLSLPNLGAPLPKTIGEEMPVSANVVAKNDFSLEWTDHLLEVLQANLDKPPFEARMALWADMSPEEKAAAGNNPRGDKFTQKVYTKFRSLKKHREGLSSNASPLKRTDSQRKSSAPKRQRVGELPGDGN